MMQESIQKASQIEKTVNARESILGRQLTDFKSLEKLKTEFAPFCKLWFFIRDFVNRYPS